MGDLYFQQKYPDFSVVVSILLEINLCNHCPKFSIASKNEKEAEIGQKNTLHNVTVASEFLKVNIRKKNRHFNQIQMLKPFQFDIQLMLFPT